MNDKENKVFKGFLGLSSTEKDNLIKELSKYQNATYTQRQITEREVQYTSSVGPKNTICDCCGR